MKTSNAEGVFTRSLDFSKLSTAIDSRVEVYKQKDLELQVPQAPSAVTFGVVAMLPVVAGACVYYRRCYVSIPDWFPNPELFDVKALRVGAAATFSLV